MGKIAREESAKLILTQIQRIAGKEPVILTGDFNSTDTEPPYVVITKGTNPDFFHLNDSVMNSVLPHFGPDKTYSGFHLREGIIGDRIDYVFVTSGMKVYKHATLSDIKPDERFPSDHLPVYAELQLP